MNKITHWLKFVRWLLSGGFQIVENLNSKIEFLENEKKSLTVELEKNKKEVERKDKSIQFLQQDLNEYKRSRQTYENAEKRIEDLKKLHKLEKEEWERRSLF